MSPALDLDARIVAAAAAAPDASEIGARNLAGLSGWNTGSGSGPGAGVVVIATGTGLIRGERGGGSKGGVLLYLKSRVNLQDSETTFKKSGRDKTHTIRFKEPHNLPHGT